MTATVQAPRVAVGSGHRQLYALTTVRIFAAMHVVLAHALATSNIWSQIARFLQNRDGVIPRLAGILCTVAQNITSTARWSVSLFFVLSGFILTFNYFDSIARRNGVKEFWIARFARIYPVYLLAMLLQTPPMIQLCVQAHQISARELLMQAGLFLALVQAWWPRYSLAYIAPGWSLSVETFFYLTFPLLIKPIRKYSSRQFLLGVIAGSSLLAIGWMGLFVGVMRRSGMSEVELSSTTFYKFIFFSPIVHMCEFAAGAALGRLFLLREGRPTTAHPTLVALVALGAVLALESLGDTRARLISNGGMTPLFCLLIWALATPSGKLARLMSWTPLVFLGEASYAVYICHWPLGDYFFSTMVRVSHRQRELGHIFGDPLTLMLYLIFVLGTCSVIFQWFEVPARSWIRKSLVKRVRGG